MKTYLRYTLLCLFALSSALCGAKVTCGEQNLHKMYNASPKTLEVKGSVGKTDFVTYTCSGEAKFWRGTESGNEIAIYLVSNNNAQVTTTRIQNLDHIIVTYLPASDANPPKVAISTNGVDGWIDLTPVTITTTSKEYHMPSVGDYYVRIKRNGADSYIKVLEYCCLDLSGCPNCFLYKPE